MDQKETNLRFHELFEISLILKGSFAILETLSGFLLYFISEAFISRIIIGLTQEDLSQDPHDFIANHIVHFGQSFSGGAQHFAGIYLISHGLVKLVLIIGLMRKYMWFYPISITVFGCFIIYQLYRYTFTGSVWLLVLTVFDLVVMYLIWREYQTLRHHESVTM